MAVNIPLLIGVFFAFLRVGHFTKACAFFQVALLFVIGAIDIVDPDLSIFGLGFALIGLYLAYKYGFLNTAPLPKVVLFFAALFLLIFFSTDFSLGWARGLTIIAFCLFFYSVIGIGEWDFVQKYNQEHKKLEKALDDIKGKKIDLLEAGFTPRELEIGRLLIDTMATDKELAWELQISTNTMRNHMTSMRTKTESKSKQHLIDSLRWYYHNKENEKHVKKKLSLIDFDRA